MHERVARADRSANLGHQQATLAGHLQNFAKRHFEVLLDIVAQRLQWRNVENFGAVLKIARKRLAHQPINASEKRSQGLTGAGGSRNQCSATRQNMRPSLLLRLSGRAKSADKPVPDQRVGPSKCGGGRNHCDNFTIRFSLNLRLRWHSSDQLLAIGFCY